MSQFIHLHNHSHYSLLDAACRIDDLVAAAVAEKMPALALTDHGVLFGAIEFYKKANKAGMKPIVGMEAYIITKGKRTERTTQQTESGGKRGAYHHLVLLAKDFTGYKNLLKLCSIAHLEGFYYKPRIDTEVLQQYREGLVALSACAGGVVSAHLANGNDAEAYEAGEIYKNIFGDDFLHRDPGSRPGTRSNHKEKGPEAREGPGSEARGDERHPLHETRACDRPQYSAAYPRFHSGRCTGLYSTPVSDGSGLLQIRQADAGAV